MQIPRTPSSDQAKKSALESDYTPLYAVAGLTDALADALKSALADTQGKASRKLNELSGKRPVLEQQAKESADEVRTFVITLPEQFKNLPESTKARIAELQKQANELIAQATNTYGDLAGRGKQAVDDAVGSARKLSTKAEKRVDQTGTDFAPATDPAFEKVQEDAATPKAASKKAPAKKTPAKKMAASADN